MGPRIFTNLLQVNRLGGPRSTGLLWGGLLWLGFSIPPAGGKLFSRNPLTLCYDSAVGFKGFSNSSEVRRHQPDFRSERNLAVAILRQAWHEAVIDLCGVKETSRKDYSLLKKKAIEWICSDDDGFPYWCQLADVDHTAVRQKLSETLDSQYRSPGLRIANVPSPVTFPLR